MERCSSLSFLLLRKTVLSSHVDLAREARTVLSKMSHDFPLVPPTCQRAAFAARNTCLADTRTQFATRRRRSERGGVIRVEITRRRALTPSLERLANKSSTFLADVARGDSSEKQPGRREFRRSGPVDETLRKFMARMDGNSLR